MYWGKIILDRGTRKKKVPEAEAYLTCLVYIEVNLVSADHVGPL
jgi:hypothetical protein